MSDYFYPTRGLFVRGANGRPEPVDAQPAYADVTHIRQVPFQTHQEGATLEGYAAVFDTETVIDSWWEGRFREVFRQGAFDRTIREDRQIIQFDHGMGLTPIADMPIGSIDELSERAEGLYIRATLRDDYDMLPLLSSIRNGSVQGMSIAFRVRDERLTKAERAGELDLREVTDVRLFEAGPVTWPAYETTSVQVNNQNPVLEPPSSIVEDDDGSPEGTGVTSDATRTRLALARLHLKGVQ